jgi:hypothetical protein
MYFTRSENHIIVQTYSVEVQCRCTDAKITPNDPRHRVISKVAGAIIHRNKRKGNDWGQPRCSNPGMQANKSQSQLIRPRIVGLSVSGIQVHDVSSQDRWGAMRTEMRCSKCGRRHRLRGDRLVHFMRLFRLRRGIRRRCRWDISRCRTSRTLLGRIRDIPAVAPVLTVRRRRACGTRTCRRRGRGEDGR